MIEPINGHLVIQPLKHDPFISSDKTTYEEIGIVVVPPKDCPIDLRVADKVYFDSWLAAKYPNPLNKKQFYWLVKYEDIRAFERNENKVPK